MIDIKVGMARCPTQLNWRLMAFFLKLKLKSNKISCAEKLPYLHLSILLPS